MLFSKPGGDEPRLVLPPSAGDQLLEASETATIEINRALPSTANSFVDSVPAVRGEVSISFSLTGTLPGNRDGASVLAALARIMTRPIVVDDETEGGAL